MLPLLNSGTRCLIAQKSSSQDVLLLYQAQEPVPSAEVSLQSAVSPHALSDLSHWILLEVKQDKSNVTEF